MYIPKEPVWIYWYDESTIVLPCREAELALIKKYQILLFIFNYLVYSFLVHQETKWYIAHVDLQHQYTELNIYVMYWIYSDKQSFTLIKQSLCKKYKEQNTVYSPIISALV